MDHEEDLEHYELEDSEQYPSRSGKSLEEEIEDVPLDEPPRRAAEPVSHVPSSPSASSGPSSSSSSSASSPAVKKTTSPSATSIKSVASSSSNAQMRERRPDSAGNLAFKGSNRVSAPKTSVSQKGDAVEVVVMPGGASEAGPAHFSYTQGIDHRAPFLSRLMGWMGASLFMIGGMGRGIGRQCGAEFIGTLWLVLFGTHTVAAATLLGAYGLFESAIGWGMGLTLAIYCTGSISGAHLNPAISIALAIFRRNVFSWKHLIPYIIAQFLGGFFAGMMNFMIFRRTLVHYEDYNDLHRNLAMIKEEDGNLGFTNAMNFGCYFPNPGFVANGAMYRNEVQWYDALLIEAWGTGILMFVILAVTDSRQTLLKRKELAPIIIGMTLALLILVYAPFTQAGWNPARDFGPRVFSLLLGFGKTAIPGPKNAFWIYIVGPIVGAIIGAAVYDLIIGPGLIAESRAEMQEHQGEGTKVVITKDVDVDGQEDEEGSDVEMQEVTAHN